MTIHRKRTGFTLVEMLVVITIIAILAAVLVAGAGRCPRSSTQHAMQSELASVFRQHLNLCRSRFAYAFFLFQRLGRQTRRQFG